MLSSRMTCRRKSDPRFLPFLSSLLRGRAKRRRRFRNAAPVNSAIEVLEDRTLLSVIPSLAGTDVTFTGDGATDNLTLRVNAAGEIVRRWYRASRR